jgi:catechol 2,3-dioxygenase-like lactoylglutathione lyase family enzyme
LFFCGTFWALYDNIFLQFFFLYLPPVNSGNNLKKMAGKLIRGIQQVGIGVKDVDEAFAWYRKSFGTNIEIFDEEAVAEFMLPYTGGTSKKRRAVLAINMQGGGGFEIWQHKERVPVGAAFEPELGDLGIFVTKLKSKNVEKSHTELTSKGLQPSDIKYDPNGRPVFFIKDPYGNIFQVVEGDGWVRDENHSLGNVNGVIIGVSDIENAQTIYGDILEYDDVIYRKEGVFDDLSWLPGGQRKVKRILLGHTQNRKGGFSKLYGPSQIELVQVMDKSPRKIFENRMWGDFGFIHLCYDIQNMGALKAECEEKGCKFTVDSYNGQDGESFDMGEAAGHFSYIEDPDGTLIEFVETHKVPLLPKIGWYYNLKKRSPEKDVPNWILNALRFNKVKD